MLKLLYKLSHYLYEANIPLFPRLIMLFQHFLFNCSIPYQAAIGKGTRFSHGGIAVVIHHNVIIGSNCVIGTCVTIGGRSKNPNVPRIGNNVYIATGAKVIGDVTIGDNVVVGANNVVTINVPNNCIIAGIPAKVIKKNIDIRDYM